MKPLPRLVDPEVSDLRRRVAALEAQISAIHAVMGARQNEDARAVEVSTMQGILSAVSASHGLTVAAIIGKDAGRRAAHARAEAMFLARQGGRSLQRIARAFNCHHTTVLHGIRQHEKRLSNG